MTLNANSRLTFPFSGSAALPALAVTPRRDVRVHRIERVTALAVRLGEVLRGWRRAPQHVHTCRHCFEMIGIYAAPISAEVIDFETDQDRADEESVGGAVRELGSPKESDLTISMSADCACPVPATCLGVDLHPRAHHPSQATDRVGDVPGS